VHRYRSLHVMAIDSGTAKPFLSITLVTGPSSEHTCTAQKSFDMEGLDEVRDIIDWSAEAYAQAFDQLTDEGWRVKHHAHCQPGTEVVFGA